jgi:hypothetical protein
MRPRDQSFLECGILLVLLASVVISWSVTFMFVGKVNRDAIPERYLTRPSVYENRMSSDSE